MSPLVLPPVPAVQALRDVGLLAWLREDVLTPRWTELRWSTSRQPGRRRIAADAPPCTEMCRHTTVYLMRLLAELGIVDVVPQSGWCVGRTGRGLHAWLFLPGGPSGKPRDETGGHAPHDGPGERGGFVLDLTAEQFGGALEIWAPAETLVVPSPPGGVRAHRMLPHELEQLDDAAALPRDGVRYHRLADARCARQELTSVRRTAIAWERAPIPPQQFDVSPVPDPRRASWLREAGAVVAVVAVAEAAHAAGERTPASDSRALPRR